MEFARLSRAGVGGVPVGLALALIRRGSESVFRFDALRDQAAASSIPIDILFERHRYDQGIIDRLRRIVGSRRPQIIETMRKEIPAGRNPAECAACHQGADNGIYEDD